MPTPEPSAPQRAALLRLHQAGCRVTASRRAVLDALDGVIPHFSAEELWQHARATRPGLGRATVYRTLDLLTRLGVVRPLPLDGPELRYILAEGGHHHLVCADCRSTVEFEDCVLEELGDTLAARHGFQLRGHLLELYGLCPNCQIQAGAAAPADPRLTGP